MPAESAWAKARADATCSNRRRIAGNSAHEVRTWVAAAAAAERMGNPRTELRYYHLVPEWITGMGIVGR